MFDLSSIFRVKICGNGFLLPRVAPRPNAASTPAICASVDDPWPRPCDHCGVGYDGRFRGVEGRFHMAVFRVDQSDDGVALVGHWREGVVPEGGHFVLTRPGSGDLSFTATALAPPSEMAGERGQLALRVLTAPDELPRAAAMTACVWGQQ